MKTKCSKCGKEVDPTWEIPINLGRKKVYLCNKCKEQSEKVCAFNKSDKVMKWRKNNE